MSLNKGHRMQQVYIGNTTRRQPDPRVLLCCPLLGDTKDLSRYHNPATTSAVHYTTGSEWNHNGFHGNVRYDLAKHLDATQPWTIEIWWAAAGDRNTQLYAGHGCLLASNYFGGSLYNLNAGGVAWREWGPPSNPTHAAYVSDGTTVRTYINGTFVTINRDTSRASVILDDVGWISVNVHNSDAYGICNLRVVQAALHRQAGGIYVYDVPWNAPYTGMEVLP